MSNNPQLGLLNEFVGRPEPSERLVSLACLQSLARIDYMDNPLVAARQATISGHLGRAQEAEPDSFEAYSYKARAVAVFTLTAAQTLPSLLRFGMTTRTFVHQLKQEYGDIMVESDSPEANQRNTHPCHYASAIVNYAVFQQPQWASFD